MKKNLFRILIMSAFIFVLSRMQVGGTKLYYGQQGQTTSNFQEALQFGSVGEAYNIQISSKDEWEIESVK